MPAIEDTQDDVAAVAQPAVAEQDVSFIRRIAPRLTSSTDAPPLLVHVDEQLVAGDAGVVHDDVEAAVPRRARARGSARPASAAVTSSCSAVPPTRLAVRASASPAAGMSTQTTVAPSRARTSAIAAPMPRAAPVTTATLPSSGRAQSAGSVGDARPDADDLAVDVGRARPRAGSAASTSALASAPSSTRTRLAVAPARSSLPMRAGDALEGAPGGGLRRASIASRRSRPTTTTRPLGRSPFRAGADERPQDSRGRRGSMTAVRSTTTAPTRSPEATSSTCSTPSASSRSRRRAPTGASPRPPTRTGPSTSGAPAAYRRSCAGRGQPELRGAASCRRRC